MRRVVLLAFIWGWSFLFIKVAIRGLTPATVAWARVALGLAVMLVMLKVRGTRMPRGWSTWRHFTVMGLTYSVVPFTLLAWSEQHITSALTAVVNASTPLFAALAAAVALHERLTRLQLGGLTLGFVGVAVAAGIGGSDLASSSLAGVLAAALASACYGFSFAYAQRNLAGVPPLVAASGQLVAGTVIGAPLALMTSLQDGVHLDARIVASIVLLGAVGTGIAYIVNYQSIAAIGPTRASLVTYLVPVVAVSVGVLFLGEPFHLRLLVGGGLTVLGIALLQERIRRLRRVPVVAAILSLLALGGCDAGGSRRQAASGGTSSTAPSGSCEPVRRDPLDPGSQRHVLPGATPPSYLTEPPSSGPHQTGATPSGAVDEPVPGPVQVAVLEDGGVVVQHREVPPAEREALERLAGPQVLVAPAPDLPAPLVATAWRHRLVCRKVDVEAVRTFIAVHGGHGAGHAGAGG